MATWTSSSFSTDNQYIKYRIKVTESSYSVANNTSTVSVTVDAWRTNTGYTTYGTGTCYCKINGTKYSNSISSSQRITHNSHTVLFSKSNVVIAHGVDGKKNLSVSAWIKHQRFTSKEQGFTVTLTQIPRKATITSAEDISSNQTATSYEYNNPAGSAVEGLAVCLSLDGVNPLGSWRNATTEGGTHSFYLTQAERDALTSACSSNSMPLYYILRTTIGGVNYDDVYEATYYIEGANPLIILPSYEDTNPTTLAITNDNTQIIQGLSTVRFNVLSIEAQAGATLSSLDVTVNGVTVSKDLEGASSVSNCTLDFGVIDSASDVNAVISVTDSRGNTASEELPLTLLAWSLPSAIINCERKNNYYSETYLTVNATMSSLDSKNALTLSFKYKEEGASTWSADIPLVNEQAYTVSLDNTKTWQLQVTVADLIGSVIYNLTVDKGLPLVFFDRLKRSVGIEKIPQLDNGLDSAGEIHTDTDLTAGNDITAGRDVNITRDLNISGDVNAWAGSVRANYGSFGSDITANGAVLPHKYRTTEQVIGYWIDNSAIFELTIELSTPLTVNANAWLNGAYTHSEDIIVLSGEAYYYNGTVYNFWGFFGFVSDDTDLTKVNLYNSRDSACQVNVIVLRYLKAPPPPQ